MWSVGLVWHGAARRGPAALRRWGFSLKLTPHPKILRHTGDNLPAWTPPTPGTTPAMSQGVVRRRGRRLRIWPAIQSFQVDSGVRLTRRERRGVGGKGDCRVTTARSNRPRYVTTPPPRSTATTTALPRRRRHHRARRRHSRAASLQKRRPTGCLPGLFERGRSHFGRAKGSAWQLFYGNPAQGASEQLELLEPLAHWPGPPNPPRARHGDLDPPTPRALLAGAGGGCAPPPALGLGGGGGGGPPGI